MHPKEIRDEQQRESTLFISSFKSDIGLYLTGTIPCMIHISVRPFPGTDSKGKPMIHENIFFSLSSKTLTLFWISVPAAQPVGGRSITFTVIKIYSCTAEECNFTHMDYIQNSEQPPNNKYRVISFLPWNSLFSLDRFSYSLVCGRQNNCLSLPWIICNTVISLTLSHRDRVICVFLRSKTQDSLKQEGKCIRVQIMGFHTLGVWATFEITTSKIFLYLEKTLCWCTWQNCK